MKQRKLLRLGPPLRPAHALRAAGALRLALPGPALPRRDRLHRPGGRPPHELAARAAGSSERTIVVLTADHGESLGEHGEADARLLHLRRHDARAAHRAHALGPRAAAALAQVSGVDLMPTVLDLRGPRRPSRASTAARWRARCSTPRRRSDHVAYSETYFPRYHFGWQHLRGAARRALHSSSTRPSPSSTTSPADPGETRNIYQGLQRARRGAARCGWRRSPKARAGSSARAAAASTPRRCSGWPRSATSAT